MTVQLPALSVCVCMEERGKKGHFININGTRCANNKSKGSKAEAGTQPKMELSHVLSPLFLFSSTCW